MGIKTAIEYCDSTINPLPCCAGCELYHRNPALNHCYAATLVRRYAGKKGWPDDFNTYQFFEGRIEKACNWSDLTGKERSDKPWLNGMPRMIFLNDLGDGFSPIAPLDWALPYIEMMEQSPHTWLWLTKWPQRMTAFFESLGRVPHNFWLGTSVTGQNTIRRARVLAGFKRQFPDTKTWISAEPLLSPVDLRTSLPEIDWVACGGESGSNRRHFNLGLARNLRDQCRGLHIPYFFKQVDKVKSIPADLQIREMPK